MNNSIVAELQSHKWAMEPGKLKAFIERMAGLPEGMAISSLAIAQKPRELKVINGTAVIAISGVLLKTVPGWIRFFGIEATGYDEIREQVAAALANKAVKNIHLQVDSPGGQVAGQVDASDAIFNARQQKPVTATIEDLGASGAYWLTSQAESIEVNRNTMVGSIGVYSVYVDYSKMDEEHGVKVIVIRSGEHKGMGFDKITEEQVKGVQKIIDGMAENFIEAIARGRGRDTEDIRELATGQLWIAAAALELGLVDAVVDKRNQSNQIQSDIKGETVMKTEDEIKAEQAEQIAKATAKATAEGKEAAISEEKQRVSKINEKFGENPEFAFKAVVEGWTLAEAHEAYNDVLREKLKARGTAAPAANERSQGAEAIATGDTDGAGSGDFIAEARELAETKKITVTAAMKKLARTRPNLHQAFLSQSMAAGRAGYAASA